MEPRRPENTHESSQEETEGSRVAHVVGGWGPEHLHSGALPSLMPHGHGCAKSDPETAVHPFNPHGTQVSAPPPHPHGTRESAILPSPWDPAGQRPPIPMGIKG